MDSNNVALLDSYGAYGLMRMASVCARYFNYMEISLAK